ncbi:phospholipase A [Xenorhabdus bovienii]|uniref:Phospholipase A n=1 Tax=Xenorhabdus bovienii TaxID=40576 RepID=A0AAJ1JBS8_XENBV|nr:phospholipase A [Xenorhabdus bovienii]MDE1479791.1 phospholipase A [Xenorhabdus bovienii]MDE1481906.1 phospholipase A [Xenorhabdus bovienii]MDE1488428.1 phospholipase A [Xenorhabdus bovienii]MDE1492107.1 phospholipase A [Xenorhabdus bovienii]
MTFLFWDSRFYTQLFSGYGESMIDDDFGKIRFGIDTMLNDMLSLFQQ